MSYQLPSLPPRSGIWLVLCRKSLWLMGFKPILGKETCHRRILNGICAAHSGWSFLGVWDRKFRGHSKFGSATKRQKKHGPRAVPEICSVIFQLSFWGCHGYGSRLLTFSWGYHYNIWPSGLIASKSLDFMPFFGIGHQRWTNSSEMSLFICVSTGLRLMKSEHHKIQKSIEIIGIHGQNTYPLVISNSHWSHGPVEMTGVFP